MYKIFLFAMLVAQTACSTTRVIRDRAYEDSVNAYRRGDPTAALEKFPDGERGGLITSIEKSWLNAWTGRWDAQPLQKQVDTFTERQFTSLSREAGYFLLQEAEEGYVPSEHEIVVLYLLSGTHFIKTGKSEDAAVELRRAGYVLDRFWDDAALRLWLGSLWAAAGKWEEALVDFRASHKLKPTPELASIISGRSPRTLTLHFYGAGPSLRWIPGEYTPAFLQAPEEPTAFAIRASTLPWFKRHEQRNTALRDTLVKSNFMAQYVGSKTLTETERGIHKSAVWSIRAAVVAVTTAVVAATVYLFSQSGASAGGEAMGALVLGEIGAGAAGWKFAGDLDRQFERSLETNENRKNEDLRIYRVARFMPGWIALEASDVAAGDVNIDAIVFERPNQQVRLINHY